MRELLNASAADNAELESYKTVKATMFDNAPPEYYGNLAEQGEEGKRLLEAEAKAEQAGAYRLVAPTGHLVLSLAY